MRYLRWLMRLGAFPFYFIGLLIRSNAGVIYDILTPGLALSCGIARIPLRCRTELEITVLANLISITPGTLTLAVREDPSTLYVHDLYVADGDEVRTAVQSLETRVLRALRPSGDVPAAGQERPEEVA